MELSDYQREARKTAIYPKKSKIGAVSYLTMGLTGEAGEFANKVKKVIRDGTDFDKAMVDELGDVLWYLSQLAEELGTDLDSIAAANLEKLRKRYESGKISGSGDYR
ncbi:MAG: nucleoside triphosphate pyrophosphohydrolase family protein [Candidatus Marsarchaeota archaeon]|jgi:NTP pyrophosphatase (non-canonical NTP hydrolase)|nr:nucleoside triphosphate pyrophosphohydrolase family protein [Candidatus Marsarchaeota archaeon]